MIAATGIQTGVWLLVALPALSAAVLLIGGRRTDRWGHLLGAGVPVVLFVYAVILFFSPFPVLTSIQSRGDQTSLVPSSVFQPLKSPK